MSGNRETDFALYPLTASDIGLGGVDMIKTWIVEGHINEKILRGALDRVVAKWPLLAGRIEFVDKKPHFRVPFGNLPPGYETYSLTSRTSHLPLSHHVKLPLAPFSEIPPIDLFMSNERYKLGGLKSYESAPFTHWHITYFEEDGEKHSCIGVLYSHALFDAVGSSMLLHAVEAELAGKEWDVPPSPPRGLSANPYQALLEKEISGNRSVSSQSKTSSGSARVVGILGLLAWILGDLIRQWIYGSAKNHIIIPHAVHTWLSKETRKEAEAAGLTDVRLAAGDILVAWAMKAVYKGENSKKTISFSNAANVRSEWSKELSLYPHNCIVQVAYPPLTVHQLATMPVYQLAHKLTVARMEGSRIQDAITQQALHAEAMRKRPLGAVVNNSDSTDETFLTTNASVARIAHIDWTGAGGGKTIAHYRMAPIKFVPLNVLLINGWLNNGDLVLNSSFTTRRAERLREEYDKLVTRYQTENA
ncbi:hypothetical protein CC2G_012251 [Coprinopsis cinerea AmutBmut pab1-1]|nr:hypothetical protein CC2G_012251 [Coprinopsis cinerea AmutBmut pab1-1]